MRSTGHSRSEMSQIRKLSALVVGVALVVSMVAPAMAAGGVAAAANTDLSVDVAQNSDGTATVTVTGDDVDNGTVSVAVTDDNATYGGAGDYGITNGTVELPAPSETVNVSVTATVDDTSASTEATLVAGGEDEQGYEQKNFGLYLTSFMGELNSSDTDGPRGLLIADFVVSNNPSNAPGQTGPPSHAGPDGDNETERGPPEDRGPDENETERGPPEDRGPDADDNETDRGPPEDRGPNSDENETERGPPEDRGPDGDDNETDQGPPSHAGPDDDDDRGPPADRGNDEDEKEEEDEEDEEDEVDEEEEDEEDEEDEVDEEEEDETADGANDGGPGNGNGNNGNGNNGSNGNGNNGNGNNGNGNGS